MNFEFISFEQSNNISVLQFTYLPQNTFDYITVSKAIKNNFIEVSEVSTNGSVNNLTVKNNSEYFVFFSDGDILVGAKQNRVLNTSILLEPKSTTVIPVSCVEQGRWHFKSRNFDETNSYSPNFIRKQKIVDVHNNLKIRRGFYADQGKVWKSIDHAYKFTNNYSQTSDLNELLENNYKKTKDIISSFKHTDKANGIAVFINDKFLNLDIYNRTDVFVEYFEKIIQSALNEFIFMEKSKKVISEHIARTKVEYLLNNPELIEELKIKSVAAGKETRFLGKDFAGFKLELENHLIHQSIINLNE